MPPVTVAPTQLRPLGVGEVLDVALKIVWRNAGTLIRVVVFVVLPVQIVLALLALSIRPDSLTSGNSFSFRTQSSSSPTFSSSDVKAAVGYGLIALLLTLLSSTLASAACFRAIATAYLGERTDWRSSISFALRRLHSVILVTVLVGLAALFGAILCLLPGIYFGIAFSLGVPVLLTEGKKGRRALGRSRQLVKGYWWRVFGITVLGYILSSILSGAIEGAVVGLTSVGSGDSSFTAVVVNVVAGTGSKLVTTPFVAAFAIVLYFDLRVRKEAFDLQLLAERLGVEPPPGALLQQPAPVGPPELSGDEPPFWPPPPGWKPRSGVQPTGPPVAAPPEPSGDEPQFWPPPPGWKPRSGADQ
jgi:uncharacterized membrane protein